ncbi:MAG: hypothetical protein IT453_16865 [Planctomycetes bacterium]|nr:hypothetical protein [Planctomycetota bacterium]
MLHAFHRFAFALLAATALVALAPAARAQSVEPGSFDRCVLDAIGHPDRQVEAHARALAEFGSAALPRAFELAVARELVVRVGDTKELSLPISPEVQLALIAAAARAPRAEVVRFLTALAEREGPAEEALVALRILALAGSGDDIRLLQRLCERHVDAAATPPELRETFGMALASILGRHPEALKHVWALYRDVPAPLADAVIRAAGTLRDTESLGALAGLLGARRELELRVLGELGRVARALTAPFPESTREAVRGYLHDGDPMLKRAACQALVALEDVDSITALIELLDAENDVARTALDSLRRISRKAIGRDPEEWTEWLRREQRDWTRAEARVADLRSSDRAVAVAELHALGHARLFRHEAAAYVVVALERSEPELVRLACEILEELGSPVAEPALLLATEHDDASVRAAAEQALACLSAADDSAHVAHASARRR